MLIAAVGRCQNGSYQAFGLFTQDAEEIDRIPVNIVDDLKLRWRLSQEYGGRATEGLDIAIMLWEVADYPRGESPLTAEVS